MNQRLSESVDFIRSRFSHPIKTAIIFGSGLGQNIHLLEDATVIPFSEIPHFAESTVQGHKGNLVLIERVPGFAVALLQGRFHYYEGVPITQVVYPIQVLHQLGAESLIVTNAAGGINPDFEPGDLMVIEDHINLMGVHPLIGKNNDDLGPRFPDMSEAYNKKLITLVQTIAEEQNTKLVQGVYAAMSGPSYETPAEVRMLRNLGADAVGMSTVPEVIVANHMGMKVLGISCITNKAAGISEEKLDHSEVLKTGEVVRERMYDLIYELLTCMATQSAIKPASSLLP